MGIEPTYNGDISRALVFLFGAHRRARELNDKLRSIVVSQRISSLTIHSNISEATRLSASPVRNPVKKLNTTEENDTATPARAVYTQLLPEKDDEYIVKVARTLKDAKVLIECGFEYVTDMDNYKLFRKRK